MTDDWLIHAMDDPAITDEQLTEYVRGPRTVHLGAIPQADRMLIRRLHMSGAFDQRQLAELYGVTPSAISHIIARRTGKRDP